MPADDAAERHHHLTQLHQLVDGVNSHGANKQARVDELRAFYDTASTDFGWLRARLPRQTVSESHQRRWEAEPRAVLEAYAIAEGF